MDDGEMGSVRSGERTGRDEGGIRMEMLFT